jgi:CDK-activating kinase assembly factor MAT1
MLTYVPTRFNRTEEDFENLRAYNDYLNEVEDTIYNLLYNIDIEATNKKLSDYSAANQTAIEENLQRQRQGAQDFDARQAAEKEAVKLRRQAALHEAEEERREKEAERRDLLKALESGQGDAEQLARASKRTILKKAKSRRDALAKATDDLWSSNSANGSAFAIRGLKKHTEAEKEKSYDPFGGLSYEKDYFDVYDKYSWDDYFEALERPEYAAGGYDPREFYNRALCDVFAGLGVNVADETSGVEAIVSSQMATAGAAAVAAGGDRVMDDVF